jgi:hypothetical protein
MSKPVVPFSVLFVQVLIISGNVAAQAGTSASTKIDTQTAKAAASGTTHIVTINKENDVTDSVSNLGKSTIRSDETVRWVNNTGLNYYVCIPFATDRTEPFEAIVWIVPNGQSRESGKTHNPSTPDLQYNVYPVKKGIGKCVTARLTEPTGKSKGNPVLNIQPWQEGSP